MDKTYQRPWKHPQPNSSRIIILTVLGLVSFALLTSPFTPIRSARVPLHAQTTLEKCKAIRAKPGPPEDFHKRTHSDRFVPGTRPTLITNGKIWTGGNNGTEVVRGDILIANGLIMGVGHFSSAAYADNLEVIDAKGSWISPGIVDIHSHLGDGSSPALDGSEDDNSLKGTAQPWMRSVDGLNTHDDSYPLSIAGGVTTALVLPGSANAIGGQAFVIKLRHTDERSPSSMLLEPPYQINSSVPDPNAPLRWRHMKHACGENPSRVYSDTRMDTFWAFRDAYNTAKKIKEEQDTYCAKATAGKWDDLGAFPENLQWEALVDVVRGRVKVNVHCYEAVDLDALVRLSNEFEFPISAVHHASEAYIVPDVLKKAWGNTPAVALFATNSRYKREAYRSSEFAPKILAQNGLTVLMKSDHPVLDSRHLLYEAQQAHYYGLADNLALAAVTSHSADVMGMGHRVGYIKKGWDADIVLWDSHPLALGATPKQVFIDGIPQLKNPYVTYKPRAFQDVPKVPNFDKEARKAIEYEGLPPLAPAKSLETTVVFHNVKSIFSRSGDTVEQSFVATEAGSFTTVVIRGGRILCVNNGTACAEFTDDTTAHVVDLNGGSISPALMTFGSPLGLEHINQEPSTNDGIILDPLNKKVPAILGGDTSIIRAADGLQFTTRDALYAYRFGVTSAVIAPISHGFFSGLGTAFSTGATHKLQRGAMIKEVTAVHVAVRHFGSPSVSTQIAALRRLLLHPSQEGSGVWFKKVVNGELPLVIEAHSADVIATLVLLKREVEIESGSAMRMTISGATEAHLLAKELGEANVGVIVSPSRSFPFEWEDRRILPGPPITEYSSVSMLMAHDVTVAIGILEPWDARNARLDIGWISLEANGKIKKNEALALASVNLQKLLGAEIKEEMVDLVATSGGDLLEMEAKVVAIISPGREIVDLLYI